MLGWFQRNILQYPNFMIGMTLSLVQDVYSKIMYFATTYKWKWGLQEIFFFMRCCYEVTGFKCCGEICCTVKKLHKICFEVIKQVMAKNVVWRKQKKICYEKLFYCWKYRILLPLNLKFLIMFFFFFLLALQQVEIFCNIHKERQVIANLQETVFFNCSVLRGRPMRQITWSKEDNGRKLQGLSTLPSESVPGLWSSVQISNISAKDYGRYRCEVLKDNGTDVCSVVLHVKSEFISSFPLMVSVVFLYLMHGNLAINFIQAVFCESHFIHCFQHFIFYFTTSPSTFLKSKRILHHNPANSFRRSQSCILLLRQRLAKTILHLA